MSYHTMALGQAMHGSLGETVPAADAKPKSNWGWWLAGAAAVGGAVFLATRTNSMENPAPDTEPLILWHGSQRWEGPPEIRPHRGGQSEHGPGIYTTTSSATARKYAKGGGTIVRFEVDPNLGWLENTRVPAEDMIRFAQEEPRLRHRAKIVSDIERNAARTGTPDIWAGVLNNLMVNYEVLTGEHGPNLARFFVEHGIDASHVTQGDEDWVVLFNPARILAWCRVAAGETEDAPRLARKNPARRRGSDEDLMLTKVNDYGTVFETGRPVTFDYLHNTEKSGYHGATYGQDIEPAGVYMLHAPDDHVPPRPWERGTATFRSPLVLATARDMGAIYGPTGWKARLQRRYGKKGAALSRALMADGYDAVVTTDGSGGTREIVWLRR